MENGTRTSGLVLVPRFYESLVPSPGSSVGAEGLFDFCFEVSYTALPSLRFVITELRTFTQEKYEKDQNRTSRVGTDRYRTL